MSTVAVPIVPKISKIIREENLLEDALDVIRELRPQWLEERDTNGVEIKTKIFSDGITNKLLGFRLITESAKEMVMVKVYGEKTDLLIDREREIALCKLLHSKQCGAQLYAIFENGICYEFIPGVCPTMETGRFPEIYSLIASELATIHKSIPLKPGSNDKSVKSEAWGKMRAFFELNVEILKENEELRERLQNEFGFNLESVKKEIDELEEILEKEDMPVVFCHNDASFYNMIYNKEDNFVKFIDFEYAHPNYGPFDVANHFMEFADIYLLDYSLCPKKEFRSKWISHYLKTFGTKGFSQEQFERWVELCFPLSDLYWTLWCVVQERFSTIEYDFIGFAKRRYLKYKKLIAEIRAGAYSPE